MRGPGALGVYRNARGAAQRCHVGVVRPSQHSRADLHPDASAFSAQCLGSESSASVSRRLGQVRSNPQGPTLLRD